MDETLDPKNGYSSFEDIEKLVSRLVPAHEVESEIDHGRTIAFPGWDGTARGIRLEDAVASQAGLGNSVSARIVGDYETGVAVIMRPRNPLNKRRFGFFIQPTAVESGLQGFEVWQGPASKPKRGVSYWGPELLDRDKAEQSSPQVTEALLSSLEHSLK